MNGVPSAVGYIRNNSMFLLQPPAASVDFPVAHGTEPAVQQRQCLGQAIRPTIPAVQVTPCLGRKSGCVWIRVSGQDANRCVVSVACMKFKVSIGALCTGRCSDLAVDWTTEGSKFDSRHGKEICLFCKIPRPALGPPSPASVDTGGFSLPAVNAANL